VPTTAGRSRGRQGVRSRTPGAAGEHLSKIMTALITASVVVILVLVMTKAGQDIDAATQHFMLYYAGVFALIGLTASVGVGLVATDRIIMTPGHRVMAQAVHRAVSFGALAFLVIHIVTEILAQRVHVIDAFIPFLSPYRTFYIGLGTIASDLILLVVVTSIYRKRFTAHGKAWRWRAIHYTSYAAFVLGVMHGLLGGRAAKPYVDWSYGFAIALTALALVVRFLALSQRSRHSLSAPAGADRVSGGLGYSGASPLRAAALNMAQTQLGGTIQMLPAAVGVQAAASGMAGGQDWTALPAAPDWSSSSGPFPAISASPVHAAGSSSGAYRGPAFMPLGAPAYGDGMTVGAGAYQYGALNPSQPALPGPGPAAREIRQPRYEPGYDGPPRYEGAPRKHVPQDDVSSYPYRPQSYRQPQGAGYADHERGSRAQAGPVTGTSGHGPSQPSPAAQPGRPDRSTGPIPRAGTGPIPRAGSGPIPRLGTGPMPRAGTGPRPRAGTGPIPRSGTGPMRRADSGPMPPADSGPMRRADPGPMPRAGSGPMPQIGTGPMRRADSGPMRRADSGPMPRADSGPMPRADSGPMRRADSGPMPRTDAGSASRPGNGRVPRHAAGPNPRVSTGPRPGADSEPRPRTGPIPRPDSVSGSRTGSAPRAATRPSPRGDSDPRYRDIRGRSGGHE
jgi:DMSO/TMAO reductase YedYZ heme-binding membrane subunit